MWQICLIKPFLNIVQSTEVDKTYVIEIYIEFCCNLNLDYQFDNLNFQNTVIYIFVFYYFSYYFFYSKELIYFLYSIDAVSNLAVLWNVLEEEQYDSAQINFANSLNFNLLEVVYEVGNYAKFSPWCSSIFHLRSRVDLILFNKYSFNFLWRVFNNYILSDICTFVMNYFNGFHCT